MRSETHSFQARPFLCFVGLAVIGVGSNIAGHMFFPGDRLSSIRMLLAAIGMIIMAVGTHRLLCRFHGTPDALGLRISVRSIAGFTCGILGGFLVVALVAGALWMIVPFHFERGPLPPGQIFPQAHRYFWGNFGEELLFRGYPLLILGWTWGRKTALIVPALAFGLFHLTGLEGIAALKIVLTTTSCAFLFSAAFLITGTLWTAVGLHVAMNIALHLITGLDGGSALLKPMMHAPWPENYDPALCIMITVPLLLAFLLFRLSPAPRIWATKQEFIYSEEPLSATKSSPITPPNDRQ